MRTQRSAALVAATVICVLNSLGNLAILPAPLPRAVLYASAVAALAGLIGAVGLWRRQRWGTPVSAAVLAITALLAAPGVLFAPALALQVIAAVTVLVDLGGILLIFQPGSRQAATAAATK